MLYNCCVVLVTDIKKFTRTTPARSIFLVRHTPQVHFCFHWHQLFQVYFLRPGFVGYGKSVFNDCLLYTVSSNHAHPEIRLKEVWAVISSTSMSENRLCLCLIQATWVVTKYALRWSMSSILKHMILVHGHFHHNVLIRDDIHQSLLTTLMFTFKRAKLNKLYMLLCETSSRMLALGIRSS